MDAYRFAGGTAVVTGAASGMGAALAPLLAARGSDLVLVDRDAERLADVAATVRSAYPEVSVATAVVDLADPEATQRMADELVAAHPDTTLLINNAGVALGGRFDQVSLDEFDWVMEINFRSVVRLTKAFLPTLKAHHGSHVVNLSSLFGLMAPAGQAAYSSSKFAVRGFTEALRHELAEDGSGTYVGVTSVHPGGIRTRIAETARVAGGVDAEEAAQGKKDFAKLLTFPADKAAALIVEAVEKRRPRLLIGVSAKIPDVLVRVAPGGYGKLLAAVTKLAGMRR